MQPTRDWQLASVMSGVVMTTKPDPKFDRARMPLAMMRIVGYVLARH